MPIVFRFQFQERSSGEVSRIFDNYKDKWRIFSRYFFQIHRDKDTYSRLVRCRLALPRTVTLADVIDKVSEADADAARMLMDTSVLFDRAPYDFKMYILATLGVDYPERYRK